MIQKQLRYPDGIALVATKRYYFGTGGGSQYFLDRINASPRFRATIVASEHDLKSNIRDLIKVWFARDYTP